MATARASATKGIHPGDASSAKKGSTLPGAPSPTGLGHADDRTLAGRAADGDISAFEILVRRYSPMMRAYAARLLSSNNEVDDVVQEALITVWEKLPTLDDCGAVRSWMMKIVSHKAMDRIRAHKRQTGLDDHDIAAPESISPAGITQTRSQLEALSRALSELPEQQRRCWVMKELGEYSYEDMADELDLPVTTVRGLLARARKNLIPRMEAWR